MATQFESRFRSKYNSFDEECLNSDGFVKISMKMLPKMSFLSTVKSTGT